MQYFSFVITNKLSLNATKTSNLMLLGTCMQTLNINNNIVSTLMVERVCEAKFVGITIDFDLGENKLKLFVDHVPET